MRAAAIFGLGCSPKNLKPFQTEETTDWRVAVPSAADQVDIIVLFGGDGTIHRQLSKLVKLKLPVLIVPVGSGNDFARALGICGVRDSLVAWRRFCSRQNNVRAIDLGVITPVSLEGAGVPPGPAGPPQYFCSVAGVGLDAEVSRRAHKLPRGRRRHLGNAQQSAHHPGGFCQRFHLRRRDEDCSSRAKSTMAISTCVRSAVLILSSWPACFP
jgi:diacylglycerol kinase family enzyme